MKNIFKTFTPFFVAISILYYPLLKAQDTVKVESKVDKVVVFLKGAQIKRTVKCKLLKGENHINFTKISSHAVDKSIQVNSDSSVVIQSVSFQINYMDSLSRIQKIKILQDRNDSLDSEKLVLDNKMEVLIEEQELLQENQILGGEKKTMKTEDLEKACTYYREKLLEILSLKVKIQNRLKQIDTERIAINNQLLELNSKKEKPVGEVWLIAFAKEAGEKQFVIEYFINDAGWTPKYDIRAESVNKPALLGYKADVFQNTDDDWTNVQLILSSSNPSLEGTKPELTNWYLDVMENYSSASNNQNDANYNNSVSYYNNIKNDYSKAIPVENEMTISGTVYGGDDGSSLPGVGIQVKGTSVATMTDLKGAYSITVPKGTEKITFSFVGYATQEIPITGKIVDCLLGVSEEVCEEVVVVGYGVKKKSMVTGAISQISGDEISNLSLDQSLQGKIAGVSITSNMSIPGAGTKIRIRGTGSGGNSDALYIVDGLKTHDISYLDPNDIESIEILKDASSSAIYGSEGGNGVVVITTKSGKGFGNNSGFDLFEAIKAKRLQKRLAKKSINGLNKIKESQTSVEFMLDKPYTIPSDNKNYSVDIEKYEIPVHFQYSTVPKLEPSAFLLAQITEWENLNLLSGNVNIYFEGSFIGSSELDVQKTNDTLDISMGRDKAIVIDRKLKEDFNKKQGKNSTYTWEITVKNTKNDSINVNVEDQIPLTYSKDFQIELLESQNATYNKNKGELKWNLDLAPFEKKILTFSYLVKTKR